MSFDALVATDADARYYVEQRFDRPALVNGARETLPACRAISGCLTAWICEQGAAMVRGAGQLGSGQTLLAVPASEDSGTYALSIPRRWTIPTSRPARCVTQWALAIG